ncbi:erg12p [Saccharomyces arboricola H-6]|uniref:Mevalonate kinase n=1 Tax=Saccharomyces arboricola (strain H-6 / AS 2.3317 / CBS 10644) TaxID=1160507 RepID=J8PPX2_SACAR|nr:erg12p [Saccharomyces arboricola H-6]
MSLPFLTSAPGKVIIFGEHSAVYNKPAVAASVSALRTYLLISESSTPDTIELDFPDISFNHKWSVNEFDAITKDQTNSQKLAKAQHATDELSQDLVSLLEPLLAKLSKSFHYHAAFCFLYMFVCLCPHRKSIKFSLKSTLPIGAGLGSSASISVSLALAMAYLGGLIESNDLKKLSEGDKHTVNRWAFIGEKCIHGTPSGIDNAVATYGNALLFEKDSHKGTIDTNNFKFLDDFPAIPMILTYTRIPRSTKDLVTNVRVLVTEKFPEVMKPILDAMGECALQGLDIMTQLSQCAGTDEETTETSNELYERLLELIRINHGLLVAIGVSHPGLEIIKNLSDDLRIGSTKLTGAGGGGCSLTLLRRDITQEQIDIFKKKLQTDFSYETFETDLGGTGCCLLSAEELNKDLKTKEQIFQLFENEHTTKQEIDEILLPGSAKLPWTS